MNKGYWKGKKRPDMQGEKHFLWGKHRSDETKNKIKETMKKKGIMPTKRWTGGRKKLLTIGERMKMSIGQKKRYLAMGIVSKEKELIRLRHGIDYKIWRSSCFKRDNFTCQVCGGIGGNILAHHLNNFSDFVELRFAIDNGITLCKSCHIKFHKFYGLRNNTGEQLDEFIKTYGTIKGE